MKFKGLHKALLLAGITTFILASCGKKSSSDDPLTPSYSPSVVIGSDNNILYAYTPSSGEKNWEVSLPASIFASPLVYRGSVYVGVVNYLTSIGSYDTLYKINSRTGAITKKLTITPHQTFAIKATPIASDALIYLATTNDTLYAIDTGTAAVSWKFGATAPLVSSPTVYLDKIYFASTDGKVYCLNKLTGAFEWSYTSTSGNSFESSPSISSPYLYIGGTDSSVYSLYLNPGSSAGQLKWKYKTRGKIISSPASGYGKCIVGSNDFKVHCIDTTTGEKIWTDSTLSNVNSSPIIRNQTVYIASNDYNLYAINVLNGTTKWKFPTNGMVTSSPLLYNGTIYIGSHDKYFYAVDSATGNLKWSRNINGQIQCSPAIEDFSNNQNNSQVSGYTN